MCPVTELRVFHPHTIKQMLGCRATVESAQSVGLRPQSNEVTSMRLGGTEPMGRLSNSREAYHDMEEGMRHTGGKEKQH